MWVLGAGGVGCGRRWLRVLPHLPSRHLPLYPLTCLYVPLQAFLAGVAVGLTLPTAGRQQVARQRVLTAALLACALVVLVGCSILVGGFAQAHPQTVYYM